MQNVTLGQILQIQVALLRRNNTVWIDIDPVARSFIPVLEVPDDKLLLLNENFDAFALQQVLVIYIANVPHVSSLKDTNLNSLCLLNVSKT